MGYLCWRIQYRYITTKRKLGKLRCNLTQHHWFYDCDSKYCTRCGMWE